MKQLLIISKRQFGHHTNYFKYCEYLKDNYNITFVCFDTGLEKITLDKVAIKYIPWKGLKTIRGVRFLVIAMLNIARHNGIIYINYFEKCWILKKLFPHKTMILDIRTLSVSLNSVLRQKEDQRLMQACKVFDYITPISTGVAQKLSLKEDKSSILPLGADIISSTVKTFAELRLLYVGTLSGRKIEESVKGLAIFRDNNPTIPINYDIIGDGPELNSIKKLINELKLSNSVKIHGRVPHFKLKPFFDFSNIGVSYIPITEYYHHQPPTKTYEYILSGMHCIATKTYENTKLITDENGVLCDDTPESFALAVEVILKNKAQYRSDNIRDSLKEFNWENIVNNRLVPIFQNLN